MTTHLLYLVSRLGITGATLLPRYMLSWRIWAQVVLQHTHLRATHIHTHADPPTHIKNVIGVPNLVHYNYGSCHLENAPICTDNICETETKSIISTQLLPSVILHTKQKGFCNVVLYCVLILVTQNYKFLITNF